jgi:hypothetical protein
MTVNHRFLPTGSLRNFFSFSLTILIFATSAAFAQRGVVTHGIPASATSLAPGHGFRNPPGIPASATSLTPAQRGFGPRFNGNGFNHGNGFNRGNGFNHGNRFDRGNGRFFGRGQNFGFGGIWPVYVSPYDYSEVDPNAVDPNAYDPNAYDQNQNIQQSMMPQGPQSPTVIVIDSRGVHDATNDPRAALAAGGAPPPASAAVSAPAPEASGPTTLVVFRDGTRKEVQSYAIMGKELIDVSGGLMRRYPLDDVDVKATMKENN